MKRLFILILFFVISTISFSQTYTFRYSGNTYYRVSVYGGSSYTYGTFSVSSGGSASSGGERNEKAYEIEAILRKSGVYAKDWRFSDLCQRLTYNYVCFNDLLSLEKEDKYWYILHFISSDTDLILINCKKSKGDTKQYCTIRENLKIYADDWVTVHKNISIKNIEDKEEILRYIEVLDKIEKLYNEELEKCVNLYNKKYDDFFEKKNQESIQKNIQETENIFDKYKN